MATMTLGQPANPWSPPPPFPHHISQIMALGSQTNHRSSPQPQIPTPQVALAQPQPQLASAHQLAHSTPTLYPAVPYAPTLPQRNEVDLSRDRLITLLQYFSEVVAAQFQRPIRLVVHGGACMLLHPLSYQASLEQKEYLPTLPHRSRTRDVDYIHRSFVTEMTYQGVQGAGEKLKQCILMTAQRFNLGMDWMNSDADVALPMATALNGVTYDPIYQASTSPNNVELHTVFCSSNKMLTLISVNPFWAVALKLVRYTPQDASDICLLLRNGTKLSQTNWSPETLRQWLFESCWPMGYSNYDFTRLKTLNDRIEHALKMLAEWERNERERPNAELKAKEGVAFLSVNVMPTPSVGVTQLAAMGGLGPGEGQAPAANWAFPVPEHGQPSEWNSSGSRRATEKSRSSSLGPGPESTNTQPGFVAPWLAETSKGRRSVSHGNTPKSSPPGGSGRTIGGPNWNLLGGRSDAHEREPSGGFIPPPLYDDPIEYGIPQPDDDAAARKARKKKKNKEKEKLRSMSAPSTTSAIPDFSFPPPPLPEGMPRPQHYRSPPDSGRVTRATSPWQLQPGEPTDREVTGLASLRDLNTALMYEQTDLGATSLGQMLEAPYRNSLPYVPMPQHPSYGAQGAAGAWRRPEKLKKKKDGKKSKKEKEKGLGRKRDRLEKRTNPWEFSSRPPAEESSDSEDDDEDTSTDDEYGHRSDGDRLPGPDAIGSTSHGASFPQPDHNATNPTFTSYYPPPANMPGGYQAHAPQGAYASQPGSQHHSPTQDASDPPSSRPPSLKSQALRAHATSPPPTLSHPSTYPGMKPAPLAPRLSHSGPLMQTQSMSIPHPIPAAPPPTTQTRTTAPVQPVPLSSILGKPRQSSGDDAPFIPPPEDGDHSRSSAHPASLAMPNGGAASWMGPQHAAAMNHFVANRQRILAQSQQHQQQYQQMYQYQQQQAGTQAYGRPY